MTDTTTLEPQNDKEQQAAAFAVHEERLALEGDALVESLTLRERFLVEAAWDAGARFVQSEFAKRLNNPQAVTLDAAAVRDVLRRESQPPLAVRPEWERRYEPHYERRLIALVRSALRRLEHEEQNAP
jgi:hypothetical protein